MSKDTPSRLSPEQAFEQYASAVEEHGALALKLHTQLSSTADVMCVLYLTYLDLGRALIADRTTEKARLQAHSRGWIAGSRPVLTSAGLMTWWEWKEQIIPHLHDPLFQNLWRTVAGW